MHYFWEGEMDGMVARQFGNRGSFGFGIRGG